MNKKFVTALTATAAFTTYGLADQAEASSTYTVDSGDTLYGISQEYGVTVDQLKSWNNLSSDLILVNQTLTVSGGSSESSDDSSDSQSNTSSDSASESSSGGTYTVKSGDTLSKIARAHGMNYRTLMNNNNISSHIIHPGQTLSVNGSSSGSSSSSSSSASSDNSSSESASQNVSAPAPSSTSNGANHYWWGECTWYVFERRDEMGKPVGNDWGHADNWDDEARADGYTVNNSPSVGAIMQANAWTNNTWGMGHVAIVEKVNADGSILVSEMNFGSGQGVKTFRTISASSAANHNFIH
ncbi:LysM peptidoglycan-binding domain-containing protein [Salinicoccus albus]|uniref:LysM peptidoglycan-binding domain-containing protein n=1 Tax=Salinicoccus albus TaxID=418756 RepID=UPI0003707FFB|nr:CHAP domain-containing protein [Salinicoccus albus]